jgi:ribonuclease D
MDRPLFKVIEDDLLVTLASYPPRQRERLLQGPSASRNLYRYSRELREAIRRGEKAPGTPFFTKSARRGPSRSIEERRRIDRLRIWRTAAAERIKFDPGFLLPQRTIDRLAKEAPQDPDALARVDGFRRWRAQLFGEELLNLLRKP